MARAPRRRRRRRRRPGRCARRSRTRPSGHRRAGCPRPRSRARAEGLERGDVAGGLAAEAEVGADDDGGGVHGVDQHPLGELLGGPRRHVAVEGQGQHVVGAGLGEQLRPALDGGQLGRGVLGPQHRHRRRVEGHRHQRQPARVGELARPRQHPAVPEVDAVEVADHHGGRPEIGRHVGERAPDLHAPHSRRPHTNTATGRARSLARLVERQERAVGGEERGQRRSGRARADGPRARRRRRPRSRSTQGTPRGRRRRSGSTAKESASWSRVRARSRS